MKRTRQENDVEVDADQSFLDQVLNTLYDFGDGADGKQSKGHKKRKKGTDVPNEEDHSLDKLNCGNDTTDLSLLADASCAATSTASSSEVLDRKASHVEIVTFQDPLKKTKLKRAEEPEAKPTGVKDIRKKDPNEVLTIEKARLDVHRFGITGFQKQQQRVFEQDRAIMLGARPPKKEYMNYKLYQQVIKEKKLKEKEEATSELQKKKKRSGKQKSVKPKSSMNLSGQVGNFKNGMLVLSSKDIQKFNGKVRKGAR